MYLEHRHSIKEKAVSLSNYNKNKIKWKTVLENGHLQNGVTKLVGGETCIGSRPG